MGDPAAASTAELTDRLRGAGFDVVLAVEPTALAGTGPFGAAVDDCVADPERKRAALAHLESQLGADAPLLSSCHAVTATQSATQLKNPARLVGYALLPPWGARSTVECCRAIQTADAFAGAAERLWAAAGFEPVWVRDSIGLVLPRMVACLANEAAFAVMEHVATPSDVDRAMELGTRYPRGPLKWAEEVGLQRVVATLDALDSDCGDGRYRAAPLLRQLALVGADFSALRGAA
jgi:3-hydroxybutyryl-CoA dehydrogenase